MSNVTKAAKFVYVNNGTEIVKCELKIVKIVIV